jgi:DNA end-binding protein Ku
VARALWSGFLSFGLVNVPVALYTATTDQTIHFHQLNKSTSNRIRYKKVDEQTGDEVSTADILNGYDLGGGNYVIVAKDELKQAAPGRSESIEISDFVDLEQIDPMYFQQSYYLAPRGKGAGRAYVLLRQAMHETNKVGIATLVLREREHLVAVRPGEDVLMLETMYFAAEVRDASTVLDGLPAEVKFKGRELTIAKQLIESLVADWSPERYHDTYHERVEALIEQKREGREVVFQDEPPKSNVIDLMAALEASVARASDRHAARDDDTSPATATPEAADSEQQSFAGMSKAELLTLAAERAIPGRSKMSKPELVSALSTASAPNRRRKAS